MNLPAHLDVYYENFKARVPKPETTNMVDNSLMMDIDSGNEQIGEIQRVDNFKYNFTSVAPFWETRFNKEVKLDYRRTEVTKIVNDMSK